MAAIKKNKTVTSAESEATAAVIYTRIAVETGNTTMAQNAVVDLFRNYDNLSPSQQKILDDAKKRYGNNIGSWTPMQAMAVCAAIAGNVPGADGGFAVVPTATANVDLSGSLNNPSSTLMPLSFVKGVQASILENKGSITYAGNGISELRLGKNGNLIGTVDCTGMQGLPGKHWYVPVDARWYYGEGPNEFSTIAKEGYLQTKGPKGERAEDEEFPVLADGTQLYQKTTEGDPRHQATYYVVIEIGGVVYFDVVTDITGVNTKVGEHLPDVNDNNHPRIQQYEDVKHLYYFYGQYSFIDYDN